MYPLIMVANFSGNVGKTLLTKQLLVPRIPGVQVIAVEDVNAGYGQGEAIQLSAEHTQAILEKAIEASLSAPVIVDVGASNVSLFFEVLKSYEGVHEFIAHVLIPTDPSEKVQTDTLSTVHFLTEKLGFNEDKIRLVLNRVARRGEAPFEKLLEDAAALGVFPCGSIPESSTFQLANTMGTTIDELANLDPKQLLAESQAQKESGVSSKDTVQRMLAAASAKKLRVALDKTFDNLGLEIPEA